MGNIFVLNGSFWFKSFMITETYLVSLIQLRIFSQFILFQPGWNLVRHSDRKISLACDEDDDDIFFAFYFLGSVNLCYELQG